MLFNMSPIATLLNQGFQRFGDGQYHLALGCFEQAASLAHEQGDSPSELHALEDITICWVNLGELTRSIEAATRLLARARQLSSVEYTMVAGLRLANALARIDLRRRWREIKPLLLDGLTTSRQLMNSFWEVYHLMRLGGYAAQEEVGELEAGYAWLQQALVTIPPTMLASDAHYFRCDIYGSLAQFYRSRGDLEEALRFAEMSLAEARLLGGPDVVSDAQLELARVEQARGQRSEALELVEEALAAARAEGWQTNEQEGEYLRGVLERELGHQAEALVAARRAVDLAQAMGTVEEEVKALLSLGELLTQKRGEQGGGEGQEGKQTRAEARELLDRARRLSQERDDATHFAEAEALLKKLDGDKYHG